MRFFLLLFTLSFALSPVAASAQSKETTPIINHKIEMARSLIDDRNGDVGRLLDRGYVYAWDRFEEGVPELRKEVSDAVGHTFLTLAVKNGAVASFYELLRRGADVHARYSRIVQPPHPPGVRTQGPLEFALPHALEKGQHIFLNKLLEAGVNPSFEFVDGDRAIHIVADQCRSFSASRAMGQLRYHHADLNLPSENPTGLRKTAVHLVAIAGFDPPKKTITGVYSYCLDVLAVMLKKGNDVHRKDPNGIFLDADLSLKDQRGLLAIDYANVQATCPYNPDVVAVRRQMVVMLLNAGSPRPSVSEYCNSDLRPPSPPRRRG